jgi:hypothetical protein
MMTIFLIATERATDLATSVATIRLDDPPMWDGPNLYRMLEVEWDQIARSSVARAACARWASDDAVLEGIASPAEVVACCQARVDGTDAAAVLAAVLRHAATDDWAARTVLQAVLPGLAALSRRARPLVGPGRMWQDIDEVDQFLVTNAYEWITALASRPPRWPAQAVVTKTWQRLRDVADRECQRSIRQDSLSELGDLGEVPHTTAGAELAQTLVEAVERGVLEQVEGWLVYASRVLGEPIEALATQLDRHPRSLWRRRRGAVRPGAALLVTLAAG